MIWYLTSCVSTHVDTQCGGLGATILQFTIYSFYVDTRSHNWFGVAARDNSDTDCTAARGHWHAEIPGDNGGVEGEMNFYCLYHFHRYHSHLITLSLSQLHTPPWAYQCSHTTLGWPLKMSLCQSNTGLGERSELLMGDQRLSMITTHQQQASNKVASNVLSTAFVLRKRRSYV